MARRGWKPSGFDGRDWGWPGSDEPTSHTLFVPFPPVDQGESNCCIGAALTAAIEILDAKDKIAVKLSPLFSYYTSRKSKVYTGDVDIRRSLETARDIGICTDSHHLSSSGTYGPYSREDALMRPSIAARSDANDHKLLETDPNWNTLGYYRLDGQNRAAQWRSVLQKGCPVLFGFYASQAYDRLNETPDFRIDDVSSDHSGGGHAALVVGEHDGYFKIRDSRGTSFCHDGYWYLSSQVVSTGWVAESWTIAAISFDTKE